MSDLCAIYSFEHRAWWRDKSQGYSINLAGAGLYPKAEAEAIVNDSNGRDEKLYELESVFRMLQKQALDSDKAMTQSISLLFQTGVRDRT